MKILKTENIHITRRESNFDKACDEAYRHAVTMFGIDDCGHSKIKGWDRSNCGIRVTFKGYHQTGSMGGHEFQYTFRAEAVKG